MSASEKLKALEQDLAQVIVHLQDYDGDWDNAEKLSRVSRALPQILDVVEAAEKTTVTLNTKLGSGPDVVADLRAALAALEEKLT